MSLQSENIDELIKEAISHYNAKRYKECLDACERAIRLDSNCARAYHGKGLALARQKKYEEALIAYQKASNLAPQNAKIHADMAELIYNMRDYKNSGMSYKTAIQLDSQFEAVYAEKSKRLVELVFNPSTYFNDSFMPSWSIHLFRNVLLFNSHEAIALAEILSWHRLCWEASEAYLELLQLYPEDAKLHAGLAEVLYKNGDYEKSRLTYQRAIQLDSQFEAVYIDKSRQLLDEAFKLRTSYLNTSMNLEDAISVLRNVLLFHPENTIAPAEIKKIQKELKSLRTCPICYMGTLNYSIRANTATISLQADKQDEEVRIFLLGEVTDIYSRPFKELIYRYFSKMADGWEISITFPLRTYFKIEVLRNEMVIAYGLYCIKKGDLYQYSESNIKLTIVYTTIDKSSKENNYNVKWSQEKNNFRNSMISVRGRRNRRVRRGS